MAAALPSSASSSSAPIARLQCAVQHYDWGRRGSASTVARLHHADAARGVAIDEKKPYAELWMGTHKNAPSHVFGDGDSKAAATTATAATTPLSTVLGGDLPYLFKVLSVSTALSIQAHPTKEAGATLHARNPKCYPDPNHKPEMTIALTRFEAMCGFRPVAEIAAFIQTVPEFRALIGDALAREFIAMAGTAAVSSSAASASSSSSSSSSSSATVSPWKAAAAAASVPAEKPVLQKVFGAVMNADAKVVSEQLAALVARFEKLPASQTGPNDLELHELIVRLNKQYPNDVGVFCPFLLNCMVLNIGDAIFLPANEPHAYLSGDCVECMAASDNVVRAGLTPKFRDVSVLVDMLTYRAGRPLVHTGVAVDACSRVYVAPVPEFHATSTKVPVNSEYVLKGMSGAAIAIVVDGEGSFAAGSTSINVGAGTIVLIRDGVDVAVKSGSKSSLSLYRCAANPDTHSKL